MGIGCLQLELHGGAADELDVEHLAWLPLTTKATSPTTMQHDAEA